MRIATSAATGLALVATLALAGPVEVYRDKPEECPHDRPRGAPAISSEQAIARAKALLPADFCGPTLFVDGCDVSEEYALGSWRVYAHQYHKVTGGRSWSGLTHTYIILDDVGNCLANIPGTEPGARR